MINQTGYANIIPSPGDEVYGSLCFLSARDEKALDESEGVPWMYQKVVMKVWRINPKGGDWGDGKDGEEEVEATVYVDPVRKTEGRMERDVSYFQAFLGAEILGFTRGSTFANDVPLSSTRYG